jgi:hypothetical protein
MFRAIALLLLAATASAATLQVPTAEQIIPNEIYPSGNCKAVASGSVSIAVTGSDAAGNPTGYAELLNFTCQPVRSSGRGFGIRKVDACAAVTWDAASGVPIAIDTTLVRYQPPAGYTPDCAA